MEELTYVNPEDLAPRSRVRPVLDPGNQRLRSESIRMILGAQADSLKPCVGGCGMLLLGFTAWQRLENEDRNRLRHLKVNRSVSYGRCWKCAERGAKKGASGRKQYAPKVTAEIRARIPEIWVDVQTGGGGFRVLGERLGVTAERARQLVRELELSHVDQRIERAEIFLEELHHLASLGLGVYELSKALNIPCDSLVRKVDNLRHNGKTTVSFPGYFSTVFDGAEDGNFREEWEDAA